MNSEIGCDVIQFINQLEYVFDWVVILPKVKDDNDSSSLVRPMFLNVIDNVILFATHF